jgi:hypothetical protein
MWDKTTVRDVEQVIAHGVLLRELIRRLEEVIEFPNPNFPSFRANTPEDVELVVQIPGVSAEIDALSICGDRPIHWAVWGRMSSRRRSSSRFSRH